MFSFAILRFGKIYLLSDEPPTVTLIRSTYTFIIQIEKKSGGDVGKGHGPSMMVGTQTTFLH